MKDKAPVIDMQKRVLIVEDDQTCRKRLANLIREVDGNALIWEACDSAGAYKCALEHTIDVFIVGIILEPRLRTDMSGLDFIRNIRKFNKYLFTPVIIITSVEDPTNYAFRELHCFDYIEKPYNPEHVRDTLRKALRYTTGDCESKMLYLRNRRVLYPIKCENIVYIQIISRTMYIYMLDGRHYTSLYRTCGQLLEEMDCIYLFQCARGTIVNINHIKSVDITSRYITLVTGDMVDIGITFIHKVKKIIADENLQNYMLPDIP